MASTLDATIGGANANTYVTLAEAETYFGDDPNRKAQWDAFSDIQKQQGLLLAGKHIERLELRDAPRATEQALHFPTGTTVDRQGQAYIPVAVQYAQIEWALSLLTRPPQEQIDRASLQAQGVQAFSRAGISERLAKGAGAPALPPEAYAYLKPWLGNNGRPVLR